MRAAEALAAPCEVTAAVGKGRLAAVQRVRGLTPRVTALPRHARVRRPSLSAAATAVAAAAAAALAAARAAAAPAAVIFVQQQRLPVAAIRHALLRALALADAAADTSA